MSASFIMCIMLYLLTIGKLWDKIYIDTVKEDFEQAPLIDIKMMEGDAGCPSGYENIAQAYWWGLKQGCSCPGGLHVQAKLEICTDDEKKDYCKDSLRRKENWFSIINGKNMCGKRTVDYNLLTMTRPKAKAANEPYQCKNASYALCGSPQPDTPYELVWCVPAGKACPITNIHFNNGQLATSFVAAEGEPLVDVQMSQGGFPCIHYRTSHNAIKDKKYYPMFPANYKKTCEEVSFGEVVLKEADHIFRKVEGDPGVSEYTLLKENRESTDFYDIDKHWAAYPVRTLEAYTFNMYQKGYLRWKHCPLKHSNGTVLDEDFTAKELLAAINHADEIYVAVHWFYWLIQVNIYLQIIEWFFIFAHINAALTLKKFTIFMGARRFLSVLSYGFCIKLLCEIYAWNANGTIEALGSAMACHNDPALDATFDKMHVYITGLQGGGSKFCICLFFAFVLLTFIGTTVGTFLARKVHASAENNDQYTKQ